MYYKFLYTCILRLEMSLTLLYIIDKRVDCVCGHANSSVRHNSYFHTHNDNTNGYF